VDAQEISNEEEENGASSEEELVADPDSDSETDSGTGIMPPQLKFLSPKVFKATPEDDAFEWLERYESTGAYNHWGDTELRANFNMYQTVRQESGTCAPRSHQNGGMSPFKLVRGQTEHIFSGNGTTYRILKSISTTKLQTVSRDAIEKQDTRY
jgi:hypothetical protein